VIFKISLIALDDIRRAAALKGIVRPACPLVLVSTGTRFSNQKWV
jgi:hypothetical protein